MSRFEVRTSGDDAGDDRKRDLFHRLVLEPRPLSDDPSRVPLRQVKRFLRFGETSREPVKRREMRIVAIALRVLKHVTNLKHVYVRSVSHHTGRRTRQPYGDAHRSLLDVRKLPQELH